MEPDARGLQPPGIAPPARWDLIVIGAGAAGLLAATRAAERGKQVLLLEKNRKPGVKILMSGGTRCNLTHDTDRRGIVEAFGSQGKFLHSPLAALGPKELIALFHTEGVATKVEETGKVFPVSNRALDVLMALRRRLDRSGATLSLGESVAGITREGDGFQVTTSLRTLNCQKLLITTGGQSYPGCGTTGDAYRWLADLGHTIVPPRPALVPITSEAGWVRELSGVTIPDVGVKVIDPADGGRVLDTRRGSFLFTHFGLSGPVILDASRAVTGHAEPRRLLLECDFLPALTEAALDQQLREQAAAAGKKQVASILPEAVPRRLVESILAQLGIAGERRAAELSKTDRARLLQALKRSRVPVSGTRGFTKAEVTAGGVSLDEVDSRTMQSKLVPGLLLAGEVLDLDGPIGGYNFQAAFSTGWLAAERL